jgi:hypothetical protein
VNQFEDDLRAALRREEPSADFVDRVMARTPRTHAAPRRTAWVAAIAACLLAAMGNFEYQQYEGRKARRELLLALQITGSKLNIAQQKVSELNRKTIHD